LNWNEQSGHEITGGQIADEQIGRRWTSLGETNVANNGIEKQRSAHDEENQNQNCQILVEEFILTGI